MSERFTCPNCGDKFDRKRSLASHKGHCNRDDDETYVCDGCGNEFDNPSSLGGHKKGCSQSDSSKKEYKCESCGSIFEDYASRREWLQRTH